MSKQGSIRMEKRRWRNLSPCGNQLPCYHACMRTERSRREEATRFTHRSHRPARTNIPALRPRPLASERQQHSPMRSRRALARQAACLFFHSHLCQTENVSKQKAVEWKRAKSTKTTSKMMRASKCEEREKKREREGGEGSKRNCWRERERGHHSSPHAHLRR